MARYLSLPLFLLLSGSFLVSQDCLSFTLPSSYHTRTSLLCFFLTGRLSAVAGLTQRGRRGDGWGRSKGCPERGRDGEPCRGGAALLGHPAAPRRAAGGRRGARSVVISASPAPPQRNGTAVAMGSRGQGSRQVSGASVLRGVAASEWRRARAARPCPRRPCAALPPVAALQPPGGAAALALVASARREARSHPRSGGRQASGEGGGRRAVAALRPLVPSVLGLGAALCSTEETRLVPPQICSLRV